MGKVTVWSVWEGDLLTYLRELLSNSPAIHLLLLLHSLFGTPRTWTSSGHPNYNISRSRFTGEQIKAGRSSVSKALQLSVTRIGTQTHPV